MKRTLWSAAGHVQEQTASSTRGFADSHEPETFSQWSGKNQVIPVPSPQLQRSTTCAALAVQGGTGKLYLQRTEAKWLDRALKLPQFSTPSSQVTSTMLPTQHDFVLFSSETVLVTLIKLELEVRFCFIARKPASPQNNGQYLSCSTRNPGERALQRDPFLRLCEDSDWKGWMLQTASRKTTEKGKEKEKKVSEWQNMKAERVMKGQGEVKRQTWQKSTIKTRCLVIWRTESLFNGRCNAETSWTWLSQKEISIGICQISR